MLKNSFLSLFFLSFIATHACAQTVDGKLEKRAKDFGESIRCPVCEGQSIEDSNAQIALDLKTTIRLQMMQGKSDDQIRHDLIAFYGDKIVYEPPLRLSTIFLWMIPFLFFALAIIRFFKRLK